MLGMFIQSQQPQIRFYAKVAVVERVRPYLQVMRLCNDSVFAEQSFGEQEFHRINLAHAEVAICLVQAIVTETLRDVD